jgi:hypothetical protein
MNLRKNLFSELFRSTEGIAEQKLSMVPPHSVGVEILSGKIKIFGESNDV